MNIYQITARIQDAYNVTTRQVQVVTETDSSIVVIEPTDGSERIIPKEFLDKITTERVPLVGFSLIVYGVWATEENLDVMTTELIMKVDATWLIIEKNFLKLKAIIDSKPKFYKYDKTGNLIENNRNN